LKKGVVNDFWRAVDWEAETTEGDQVEQPMDLEMAMTGKESRGMGCVLDVEETSKKRHLSYPAEKRAWVSVV
jgi:hypothetical protein